MLKITSARVIVTCPGRNFVTLKIETSDGVAGVGDATLNGRELAVASYLTDHVIPTLIGRDAHRIEDIWQYLYRGAYWRRGPVTMSAIAAVDLALWDIKGQALGLPCWRLLGGARNQVPVYATFGFAFFDRDELAEAARNWVARGFKRLKMTVGHHGLQRRDEPRPLAAVITEDVQRIRAVREAVGPEVEIYIDANCSLDYFHAQSLAKRIEQYDITFFEEPVAQNDIPNLVKLRARTSIPLAAGQNEGLASRFRDMLVAQAVDVVQPNACITGGFTQVQRIAGMAQAFNTRFANGGAWPHHNMHLHAGLASGSLVEYHSVAVDCCSLVFDDLPVPADGVLTLPEKPGLGFKPNRERVAELALRPGSRGVGKA